MHTTDPNAPSSKGNEFFLGFMGNTANASVDSVSASLLVTTNDPTASVEFTVEYFGTTQTFETRKGSVTLVNLPVGKAGEIGSMIKVAIISFVQQLTQNKKISMIKL